MEKAIFITRKQDIGPDISRIYFGNEFCGNLIPSLKQLKNWHLFARSLGKGFTFVTPYATEDDLRKLTELFAYLSHCPGAEVVFNDWGVFGLLRERFPGITPVLGRLLSKQRRDPRIIKLFFEKRKPVIVKTKEGTLIMMPKKIIPSLVEHYRSSLINVPVFQKFILARGVKRVEVDNLLWKMKVDLPAQIALSVYFPYAYVTTGRQCWKFSMSYSSCKKQCRKYFLRLTDKAFGAPFLGTGGTVFYESSRLQLDPRWPGLRIVYQPRLPF